MSVKLIKWTENRLVIPPDIKNYAHISNGSRAIASSCSSGFDAAGVINGNLSIADWGNGNGWKSARVNWHPNWWGEWVQVFFDDVKTIDTIVVYSYPQMVKDRPWYNLLQYQVQYLDKSGEWVTIQTIINNKCDYNIISFEKVDTSSIRIWVNRNHYREEYGFETSIAGKDESPRILEIEAYYCNGKSLTKDYSKEKEIEIGPRGNIAVFLDPEFGDEPAVDVNRLSALFRSLGYGVTYLTADDICAKECFNKDNFFLFVHPYGKYIPMGSNLYDFLQQGGHLITFGGRAFTVVKQKINGVWIDTGVDPGITVSKARYVDYMRPYREQLGIFTVPGSTLENVAYVETNPIQKITNNVVKAECDIKGWMALGVVEELLPIDESRQYAEEGRLPLINHMIREGMNRNKSDIPLLWGEALDENYASLFAHPCARWIPIINSYDKYGRERGAVAALLAHYEGMYRGSHWAFFGVENADVLQWGNMDKTIQDIVDFMNTGIIAHDLEPGYSCYRQGEEVSFSIIIDNLSTAHKQVEIRFEVNECSGTNELKFTQTKTVDLEPNTWEKISILWNPDSLDKDLYKITAFVIVDGHIIDTLENGFTVWDQSVISSGPKVEFKNNYFEINGIPQYVVGARDSGLHLPWQPEENSLGWEEQYSMQRDFGMQIVSPVHIDWCIPGLGWGEFDYDNPIPEVILRRIDAQVQIAQKYGLIYAPCIFFCYEKTALKNLKISRRICEVFGERYKDVPGIMFYIFDDGLRHDPEIFNRWAKECVDGFNSFGRKHIVTAEMGFRQVWPDTMRRSAKHLTFSSGSVFQQSVGDPVYERLIDLRPIGKSFTVAEFVRRIPMGTPEDIHGYLAPPHVNFGMGNAMAMNWKWKTSYHTIWPSDVVFPGNWVPKRHLYAFRNEAIFFRLFRPYYKCPALMMIMPSEFWLNNSEAYTRYIVKFIRRLIEMKVDFSVIDDADIDLIPDDVRGVILPIPLELSEDSYNKIKGLAKKGVNVFIIGDLGGNDQNNRAETTSKWLHELCGLKFKGYSNKNMTRGRSLFMDQYMRQDEVEFQGETYKAQSWINIENDNAEVHLTTTDGKPVVTRYAMGKGSVWFMNDLGTDFSQDVFSDFFNESDISRLQIKPNLPYLHCFRIDTYQGPVYTMFTFPWDKGVYEVEFQSEAGTVSTVLKEQSMGVVHIIENEKSIGAVETQGKVSINGDLIVDTSGHVMVTALDGKPIPKSTALLLLPISEGHVSVPSTEADIIESGRIIDGKWEVFDSKAIHSGTGIKLNIEQNDLPNLYIACRSTEKDDTLKLLMSLFN